MAKGAYGCVMSLSVVEVNLQKGELLYQQGDPNDSAYIVESGEILLFDHVNGKRVDRERRRAGSVLGETSILTGKPRAVSVEAVVATRLYRISAEDILTQFAQLDPILRSCVETTIDFVARINQPNPQNDQVPVAPSTLRDSQKIIERFRFELDISKGLKTGQFYMAYQPIVALQSGEVRGFEALMRWQHPELGTIPPDRFIDVAERMGSVGQLTEFALIEACAALRQLIDISGRELFASINVSGQDVDRPGFVDFLQHVFDRYGVSPKQIKLEVTETALVPDSPSASANLDQMRALGCGISIDDFGTGYSNLGYLKALPLTAIKIDRAFAGDAVQNAVSRSIVRLLVGLGHELGVDVIAEGLETQDDVDLLRQIGCVFAQGYFFYKPMALPEFIKILGSDQSGQQIVA